MRSEDATLIGFVIGWLLIIIYIITSLLMGSPI